MKKRLLLIITVGVCFSPSLYAMNPPTCGVGPCPQSSAYDAPGSAGCEAGNAFVAKTQGVLAQYGKYLSSSGSTTSNSATDNSDSN
jgi:uncharacterized phage infection (PIP) family protein YhgE